MLFRSGLPTDIRATLEQAMRDATIFERQVAQQENDRALAGIRALKKTEVYVLTDAERKEWQKVFIALYPRFESIVGRETLAAIQQAAVAK